MIIIIAPRNQLYHVLPSTHQHVPTRIWNYNCHHALISPRVASREKAPRNNSPHPCWLKGLILQPITSPVWGFHTLSLSLSLYLYIYMYIHIQTHIQIYIHIHIHIQIHIQIHLHIHIHKHMSIHNVASWFINPQLMIPSNYSCVARCGI